MRLSTDPNDPGYSKDAWRYEVLLDGCKFKNYAVTVDEELGLAVIYAEDENRKLIRDAGGKQVFLNHYGKFTVKKVAGTGEYGE